MWWHPSQRTRDLPDGGVEVRFNTAGPTGVLHWVWAFLPHGRVLAPDWLVEEQRKAAQTWARHLD